MSFYSESIFPIANDLISRQFDHRRKQLLGNISGKVLEIGFGTGRSTSCYPASATEIVGLEPNPGMLNKAKAIIARNHSDRVRLVQGSVEQLPFPDQEFNNIVTFFVLCSVPNPQASIQEIKRVMKPGGNLFFIEHTAQPVGTLTRKMQELLQPLWGKMACGCHLNRNTLPELEKAGFKIRDLETLGYSGFPNFLGPILKGIGSLN